MLKRVLHSHLFCPSILEEYRQSRALTESLTDTLLPEDMAVQSMADASPTKWHLAHTSWFFETFLLVPHVSGYALFNDRFHNLFNSYYQALGPQLQHLERQLLTRPALGEVLAYRSWVDHHMTTLLEQEQDASVEALVQLGINHEQQHQELILTDIKHLFFRNPLKPAYRPALCSTGVAPAIRWIAFDGGLYKIGHHGEGFAFDNELPSHTVHLEPFSLATRLVTNEEYREFIEDGGYREPRHWLSDGWDKVQAEAWRAPLYWIEKDGEWLEFTLSGLRPLHDSEPVTHVSYYEAAAFAAWAGKRLPAEAEWEVAAQFHASGGNFLNPDCLHPSPATGELPGIEQMFGDCWEWTASAYLPYPGFHISADAVGEYNGKFMLNKMVLRGGSCATPSGHMRPSYRNYFTPATRWQFSGIRLADTGGGR